MKEIILKILRQTSLTDSDKLKAILVVLKKDSAYGFNKLVRLSDSELEKLNQTYGKQVIRIQIENLDSYIYKTGKKYKSHYLTILNWIRGDKSITKLSKTYMCAYGNIHNIGEECDCIN